jgi:hypothetical protein
MNDNLANTAAPADNNLIRSRQVSPLPIGPGGNDPTKKKLNDMNTQLTMLVAQSTVNTKFDPPVPKPVTKQVIKHSTEPFTTQLMVPSTIFIIGSLLIVYGLVAK